MANFSFHTKGGKRIIALLFLSILFVLPLFSQSIWQSREAVDFPRGEAPRIEVKAAEVVEVDPNVLRDLLWSAPHERDIAAEESTVLLPIPTPKGELASFRIVAYDISEQADLAVFPNIRTWYGINIDGSGQSIFLDWTERGFHASVRFGDEPSYFIDPVSRASQAWYQSYFTSDAGRKELHQDQRTVAEEELFECGTAADNLLPPNEDAARGAGQGRSSNCRLRSYRTAIAATAEYSNYHGATSAAQANLVQSAMVTTLNRVNQILTREVALRLVLVANNQSVYYYNSSTDPYTGNSITSMLSQNMSNLNSVLGLTNYDLGHVFSAGFNSGAAYLRSSCSTVKGGAVTSLNFPEGDPFNVDYVTHEIGHQIGANHTQNNSCQYSPSAGMEPGSGNSVMGYAGVCSPNVQSNSDAYFHGRNHEEIKNHIEFGAGDACATTVSSAVNTPNIIPMSDKVIPHSTPFYLNGQANGNSNLSYTWEQIDSEQAVMPPQPTSTQGPLFRGFAPTATPERYFPRLPDAVAGAGTMWEVLPTVAREMNFRMTARNYNATYGCSASEDIKVTVDDTHSGFHLADPCLGNQLSAGQVAQVQWNVAGTNQAPINSQRVDILLSTDGGQSFSVVASDEPNDGFATVSLPNNQTTNEAYMMVRSRDNAFFSVSSNSFPIVSSNGTPSIDITNLGTSEVSDCFTDTESVAFTFHTLSAGGASAPINFTASNLPANAVATFYPNPVQPGGTTTLSIENLDAITPGQYSIMANGVSAEGNVSIPVVVNKTGGGDGLVPQVEGPFFDEEDVDTRPTLRVSDLGLDSYEFQLSTNPNFTNMIVDTLSNSNICPLPSYLAPNTTYYWRSRGMSSTCGNTAWSNSMFTTGECHVYTSLDSPVTITTASATQVEMLIDVPDMGTVADIDVYNLDINHTYAQDLGVRLVSPDNYSSLLINQRCGSMDNIRISLDDEAQRNYTCPASNPSTFVRPPDGNLSNFNGRSINGVWRLVVNDFANLDGGSLNGFSIKLCVNDFSFLPVSWLSFSVRPEQNNLALYWETEAEENNTGFYVERSLGLSRDANWEEIGFVAAVGNEQGGRYNFIDEQVEKGQEYFYRLRQVDVDGTFDFSPIRSGQLDGVAVATTLDVFPNPSDNFFHYRWLADKPGNMAYELIDMRGQSLQRGNLQSSGGSLSLEGLPAGVYILRTEGGGVHRLLKQ